MSVSYIIYKVLTKLPQKLKGVWYIYFNRLLFRMAGVKLSRNAKIKNRVHLLVDKSSRLEIGSDFVFSSGDCINPLATNREGCIHVENDATVRIGNNVGISSSTIWAANSITICDGVRIGANCIILDTDCHNLDYRIRNRNDLPLDSHQYAKTSPVIIEENVWLGANCIVTKGVRIGARSVVGAGCVVSKDVPSDSVIVGEACRVLKK